MYAWPPNLIPQVMQSAECSWGTSRVSSRYIDWWYCIGTLKVVGWVGMVAWYIHVMQVFIADIKVYFKVYRLEALY